MKIEELYQLYLKHPSIQTDTRKLQPGDIFFALKGPNFNGNQFAKQAVDNGAAYAVVDEMTVDDERLILVDDALQTLQQLAKHHRRQFNIPFVAITGSNGKTTTKELVSTVLSKHLKTYTTQGNLNNHIGVPLTILSIKQDAEIAVIEMGANHQGEIASYCSYTLPTHGIITNCGKAHLEGFGGVEGVRKGKGELYNFLKTHDGTAIINWDYDYLQDMSRGINRLVKYGTGNANFVGGLLKSEPYLEVKINKGLTVDNIQTHLVGEYNLPNVLCAVATGKFFGVADEDIKDAIEHYVPSNSRSQMITKGSNCIILDAYNANPSSMKAAIENFAKLNAGNKVLLLGAMMELGSESLHEHQSIVELIQQNGFKKVVLVGGDYEKISHPFIYFNNATEAKNWFKEQQFTGSHILIKGSRSMQMEKVLED